MKLFKYSFKSSDSSGNGSVHAETKEEAKKIIAHNLAEGRIKKAEITITE